MEHVIAGMLGRGLDTTQGVIAAASFGGIEMDEAVSRLVAMGMTRPEAIAALPMHHLTTRRRAQIEAGV